MHELDRYVRKNSTYRLESWLFVSRVYTVGSILALLSALYLGSMFLAIAFGVCLFVTGLSLTRYTAEWTRIAKTHPDWDLDDTDDPEHDL